MELDHVIFAVSDLADAARELQLRHGLASVEGGRHLAWGTANRIVPLGDSYIELIAVMDAAVAANTAFGRWVMSGASTTLRPLGWAVRPPDLDQAAQRLGLTIQAGSGATPEGDQLRWRSAGTDRAAAQPSLPFFLEWAPDSRYPGKTEIVHRAGQARIVRLVLDGEPGQLEAWLGDHHLPVVVHAGPPAITAVGISGDEGEITLGAG